MQSLAICGSEFSESSADRFRTLEIEGTELIAGMVTSDSPGFDPTAAEQRRSALLEIAAFSCNYRDKSLILRGARNLPRDRYFTIGSEFVGTVIEVGADVQHLASGDRVIADGSWPGGGGIEGGIPTNHSSRGQQIIDERKLIKIPDAMANRAAAGFSIGAQTSYSMLRALGLQAPGTILVTAARSNTSMFAIQVAHNAGHRIVATTTRSHLSSSETDRLSALGVDELFVVEKSTPTFADHDGLRRAGGLAGFDAVIDPFFDVHLRKVIPIMAYGGRYVTCGLADQFSDIAGQHVPHESQHPKLSGMMLEVILGGIHIIGNCLGTRNDLKSALDDYEAGILDVVVDSVFHVGDGAGFLDRSFNASERFGKVICTHG